MGLIKKNGGTTRFQWQTWEIDDKPNKLSDFEATYVVILIRQDWLPFV